MNEVKKLILNKIDDMKDEIIELHQQLVKIPSEVPPGKYRPISKFVAEKMKEIGFNTKIKRSCIFATSSFLPQTPATVQPVFFAVS